VIQKIDEQGTITSLGECHTIHANTCSIKDAQDIILVSIREYTRKEDEKLNADQKLACRISLGRPYECKYLFNTRAGDAWQRIEEIIRLHLCQRNT
jgi:hypothetical protein